MPSIFSKKIIIILVIIAIFIFFSFKGENIFNKLKNLLTSLLNFFGKAFHFLANKISSLFSPLAERETWQEENKKLRDQLNKALSLVGRLYVLEEENANLRQYFGLKQEKYEDLILAQVIGRREENGTIWFVLDKGKEAGLEEGMAIVNSQGILIGQIAKVEEKISCFWPIYDSHFQAAAVILPFNSTSTNKVQAIVEGKYGSELKMSYISQEADLSIGDLVITSNIGDQIRQGLVIGEISKIEKSADTLFQEATVRPLFRESDLSIVGALKGGLSPELDL